MAKATLELYTKSELAKILKVDESSIYNYTAKGILKGYRMEGSRRIYFKRAEVEAALTEVNTK